MLRIQQASGEKLPKGKHAGTKQREAIILSTNLTEGIELLLFSLVSRGEIFFYGVRCNYLNLI